MNEHLKLISISDLNENKDSYMSINYNTFILLMIKIFPAVMFGNSVIGSACVRVSASDCLYSLTGQSFWYSFSFGLSREEKALLNAKFWVSKRLRIVIELQRIKQGNKLSHITVFLWHSRKESMWALSVKKNQGFTYYIRSLNYIFDLFLKRR